MRNPLARLMNRAFYRSPAVRGLVAAALWPRLRKERPALAHLALFDETVDGPVQRDEALFLHAVLRVVRPRTVVEVGFLNGRSALNFLTALDPDARLYSFDVDPACAPIAQERLGNDPRFRFRNVGQDELTQEHIDGRLADFIFLDASHDFALNRETFRRLEDFMAPDALLAIHDTGTVPRNLFPAGHALLDTKENWIGDEYEGEPGERAFVNWLLDERPRFEQIHLHSRATVRCGITLVQRSAPLPRPG